MILATDVTDARAQYLVMNDELLLLLFLKAFAHALARYTPLRMHDVFRVCTAAEPAVPPPITAISNYKPHRARHARSPLDHLLVHHL